MAGQEIEGDPTRPPTRLAWLLDDMPGGTRVTLIHDGFGSAADRSDFRFGWAGLLARLRAAVGPVT